MKIQQNGMITILNVNYVIKKLRLMMSIVRTIKDVVIAQIERDAIVKKNYIAAVVNIKKRDINYVVDVSCKY